MFLNTFLWSVKRELEWCKVLIRVSRSPALERFGVPRQEMCPGILPFIRRVLATGYSVEKMVSFTPIFAIDPAVASTSLVISGTSSRA